MGAVLELLWERLLPELRPAPLPADGAAAAALGERLAGFTLCPQAGEASSRVGDGVSGKTFRFGANERGLESLTPQFDSEETTFILRVGGQDSRIVCGRKAWAKGGTFPLPPGPTPAAASGAWTAGDTFTARVCLYRTPFVVTLTVRFVGDELLFDEQMNVAFGPTRMPRLTGRSR